MRTAISFEVTERESREASRHARRKVSRLNPNRRLAAAVFVLFVVACAAAGYFHSLVARQYSGHDLRWLILSVVVAFYLFLVRFAIINRGVTRLVKANNRGGPPRRRTISIEDGGLRQSSDWGEDLTLWSAISSIEEARTITIFYLGNVSYFFVPHSAFATAAERAEFVASVQAQSNQTPVRASRPPSEAAPPTEAPQPVETMIRNWIDADLHVAV